MAKRRARDRRGHVTLKGQCSDLFLSVAHYLGDG